MRGNPASAGSLAERSSERNAKNKALTSKPLIRKTLIYEKELLAGRDPVVRELG